MKKLFLIPLMIVLASVLIFGSCAEPEPTTPAPTTPAPTTPAPTPTPVKPVTLRFAYTMPLKASASKSWHEYAEEVEKQTGGKVKFDFYPGSTLFTIHDAPDSVIKRVADIALIAAPVSMKRFPVYTVAFYPGLALSSATVEDLEAVGDAHYECIEKFPELKAEFNDFKLLWIFPLACNMLASKKEIRVPDDLKGVAVGGAGVKGELVSACGGAPVAVPPPECYMNLKTGVVDAVFVNWSQIYDYKLWEVAEYFMEYDLGGQSAMQIVMNWDSWNALPPDVQKVMMELVPEVLHGSAVATMEEQKKGRDETIAAGRTVYPLTETEIALWEKACEPLWYKWVDDVKAKGVTNAGEILDYWLQIQAEFK